MFRVGDNLQYNQGFSATIDLIMGDEIHLTISDGGYFVISTQELFKGIQNGNIKHNRGVDQLTPYQQINKNFNFL